MAVPVFYEALQVVEQLSEPGMLPAWRLLADPTYIQQLLVYHAPPTCTEQDLVVPSHVAAC